MRHRTSPTFTVEVKRSSRKAEPVFKAADHLSESRRLAEMLFVGVLATPRSSDHDRRSLRDEHAMTRAVLPQAPRQPTQAPPKRRVLPDLHRASTAEATAEPRAEEPAARARSLPGPRKGAVEIPLDPVEVRAATKADSDQAPAIETPVPEQLVLSASVLEAVADWQPPTPDSDGPGSTGQAHAVPQGPDGAPPVQVTDRKANRTGAASALRPGERWKRRLPRVCW